MFANIASAFHHSESDILWFYNVEYYLMLYLILHKKSDKKVVCTLFQEGFQNGKFGWMKQKIFHAAQKKMDLIITSGRKFSFPNAKSIYIPDYCYKEENYKPYRIKAEEKKNMAVCLGTMGAGKELDEMVEAFGRIGFPLTVAGRFYDKELLNRLKDKAKDNIVFRDEYLSKEEYFSLLATAKYTVLPYSPEKYGTQTSGVLQEAVFLDTIPISYEAVLEGNEIPGVTFSKWEDLTPESLEEKQEWLSEYDRLRKQVYGEENIKKQYYSIFKEEDLQ